MSPEDKERTTDKNRGRKRKHHTRSKSGCLICRWRHVRCGEERPCCVHCLTWGTECIYPKLDRLPPEGKQLKPRFPGEQALWRVDMPRPNTAIDPFDALPISMPLRSRGLIHHFIQVCDDLAQFLPRDSQIDLVALGAQDPIVFRSIFLTAASHYALKAGALHVYESTYRFHMVECIQRVNHWLSNFDGSRDATLRCVQAIAALSITESRVGNFAAARVHFDGLLSVLEMRDSRRGTLDIIDDQELELIDHIERCVLITEKFVIGLWDYWRETHPAGFNIVHQQRRGQFDNQDQRLQALSFTPFFLNYTRAIMSPKEIDVDYFLGVMRAVSPVHTRKCTVCYTEQMPSPSDEVLSPDEAFVKISSGAADLLTWFGQSHSTEIKSKPHSPYRSAPLPICILGGLYFNRILGFKAWDRSDNIETRSFKRQMLVFKRDVQALENDMRFGNTSRDLWFIKVICATLGLDIAKEEAGLSFLEDFGASEFWCLRSWFVKRIRLWADVTGVTKWAEAKASFQPILGAQSFPRERFVRSLWEEAMVLSPPASMIVEDSGNTSEIERHNPWNVWRSRHAFFTI